MQFINTLTVLALVVASFALIVAVPVLYASSEDSGRSNRLILLGSAVWVALVPPSVWIRSAPAVTRSMASCSCSSIGNTWGTVTPVSYTHLRAHET